MKININNLKITPKNLVNKFQLSVFNPDDEILEWVKYHNFQNNSDKGFLNIEINKPLEELFLELPHFSYIDGFSPNLNKKLHIGHFSNFVIAKSFVNLDIAENLISIYGDTLEGLSKEESLVNLRKYQELFNFKPQKEFFASEMNYSDLLKEGDGDYKGCKIFDIDGEKIVGIKSNGNSSYFYQDVALASILNKPTIYLTGHEQTNHFNSLKKLFPYIHHIGLGLVKVSGKKMSSREGNVLLMEEILDIIYNEFNDYELTYNIFAGNILKSNPESDKNIDLNLLSNPKNSLGLYISYTTARLISAGCDLNYNLNDEELEFLLYKSKFNLKPNILFNGLVDYCKMVNLKYSELKIKDNPDNKKLFENYLGNINYCLQILGLFLIKKV